MDRNVIYSYPSWSLAPHVVPAASWNRMPAPFRAPEQVVPVASVTPALEEVVVNGVDVTPALEVVPVAAVTPALEEVVPVVASVTPALEEVVPISVDVTPALEEVVPVAFVTPAPEEVVPVAAVTPALEEVVPPAPKHVPPADELEANPQQNATAAGKTARKRMCFYFEFVAFIGV